jgi:L-fucose isomerase-like protein
LISHNEFSEILQKANGYPESRVIKLAEHIKKEGINKGLASEYFERAARVYLALEEITKENSYQALAVSCWPKFQKEYQFDVCSTLGRLNQNGIVASCEGDIPGALSMLLLNYLNQNRSMLMDLVKFDTEDDSVLMWHCGPTARCWANKEGMRYCRHYIDKMGIINDMVFQPQPTTIMRITGEGRKMFLATADILSGNKKSYDGSRGWFGNLRILGERISSLDFINTVMIHQLEHHFPIASGNLTDELMELSRWLNIELLNSARYQNYL